MAMPAAASTHVPGPAVSGYFRDTYPYGSTLNRYGFFAEDIMRFGDRATLMIGGRYDHNPVSLPAVNGVDNHAQETADTIEGIDDLFTWKAFSPRVTLNYKLTRQAGRSSAPTSPASTRAYRQVCRKAFTPPSRDPVSRSGTAPSSSCFRSPSRIRKIQIDRDIKPPQLDQISVGLERSCCVTCLCRPHMRGATGETTTAGSIRRGSTRRRPRH